MLSHTNQKLALNPNTKIKFTWLGRYLNFLILVKLVVRLISI